MAVEESSVLNEGLIREAYQDIVIQTGDTMGIEEFFVGNERHVTKVGDDYYAPHLSGQKPRVCVMHCSDSREIFDLIADIQLKMGEVFKIENAGNVLDGSTTALGAITYYATHLHGRDVLLLGHTGCGAVKAVFGKYPSEPWPIAEHIKLLEPVAKLSVNIISRIMGKPVSREEVYEDDKLLTIASELNVRYQTNYLEHVFNTLGIQGTNIYGAMHDIHGHYGGEKGRMYLVRTPNGAPDIRIEPYAKQLAHIGDRRFDAVLNDSGAVFNRPPKAELKNLIPA